MRRPHFWMCAAALMGAALLLGACAEALGPASGCDPGSPVDTASAHLCVFEGAATIETGFVCPDNHPFAFEMDGGMICSDSPEPPDIIIDVPMTPDTPRDRQTTPDVPSSGASPSEASGNPQTDSGRAVGESLEEDEHEEDEHEEDEHEEDEHEEDEHEEDEHEEVEHEEGEHEEDEHEEDEHEEHEHAR